MPPEQTTSKDVEDQRLDSIWSQRCNVLHRAWVQVRYNRRRQRFFDMLDKGTKSVTVVLGASLLGQYFREYLPWLATAITSLGLLALVFGYSDRKQQHKELAEQSAKLIEAIELVPMSTITAEKTASWAAEYARLVAKAPPPLKSLSIICEHEQSTADGHPDHITRPPWYLRWISDFV